MKTAQRLGTPASAGTAARRRFVATPGGLERTHAIPANEVRPAARLRRAVPAEAGPVLPLGLQAVSELFCRASDRSRVTADGRWFRCLYAPERLNLRAPLRAGATATEMEALIASTWSGRDDRSAEERAALDQRAPLVAAGELRKDPHLEMHTRGG